MRFLTDRDKKIAEAALALHEAHLQLDGEAYAKAHQELKEAKNLPQEYDCPCGKVWDGSGRLIICYLSIHQEGKWIEEFERGNEHHLAFCPDCAFKILSHTLKR
jgi:hypothetical protein